MTTRNAAAIKALEAISQLMDNPSGTLIITSARLFTGVGDDQIHSAVLGIIGSKPSLLMKTVGDIINIGSTTWSGTLRNAVDFEHKVFEWEGRRRHINHAIRAYQVQRPVIGMTNQEKEITRATAAMYAEGGITDAEWDRFISLMTWAGGASHFVAPDEIAAHKHASLARSALPRIASEVLPGHAPFLQDAAARLAAFTETQTATGRAASAFLTKGARWMSEEDVGETRTYTTTPGPSSLLIGHMDSGRPLYFDGNESLFTIAPPGTGKTQGQVIPNLLAYPGSAFILDVKGELWEATSAARRRFGDVYRFAPTDTSGGTHRYNPFDLISTEPHQAALDCQVLAEQLIPDNPNLKDPYWERRARDMLWAFAMLVACTAQPKRTLEQLLSLLTFRTSFDEDMSDFITSDTARLIHQLIDLGERFDIPDLRSSAMSIRNGLADNQRLESVMDVARSRLSAFGKSRTVREAMSASEWHPLDLRRKPGTSVYLCLSPGDLRAFAPVVRVIMQQHINALTRSFTARPGEPPVTLFIDEMPQLGYLPSISDAIDVGRGAGLRLWMFAQFLGQIRSAYGQRGDGLVNSCRVKCFMQPDNEAAAFISPALGRTRNFFTGQEQNLAEPHELMGRPYSEKLIALARGDLPVMLERRLAYTARP